MPNPRTSCSIHSSHRRWPLFVSSRCLFHRWIKSCTLFIQTSANNFHPTFSRLHNSKWSSLMLLWISSPFHTDKYYIVRVRWIVTQREIGKDNSLAAKFENWRVIRRWWHSWISVFCSACFQRTISLWTKQVPSVVELHLLFSVHTAYMSLDSIRAWHKEKQHLYIKLGEWHHMYGLLCMVNF